MVVSMYDGRKEFAFDITERAGDKLLNNFRETGVDKRGTSKEVKSVFDDIADDIILDGLEEKFPNDSYLTEESGYVEGSNDYLWIIDPLDGTGNFENANPFFSVSVSLWKDGKPVLGVIEAPALKERFYADKDGAYRRDLRTNEEYELSVSDVTDLGSSYFVFCEGNEKSDKRLTTNFREIYCKSKDFRKIGSAALELSWVASGRAEGYITYKMPIWDIGAGIYILKQAGGELMDFNMKQLTWKDFERDSKFDLLATNGAVSLDFSLV